MALPMSWSWRRGAGMNLGIALHWRTVQVGLLWWLLRVDWERD
jgi:hypothetical protein